MFIHLKLLTVVDFIYFRIIGASSSIDYGKTIQKRSYAYAFQRMRLMGGWSMAVDGDEFPQQQKSGLY